MQFRFCVFREQLKSVRQAALLCRKAMDEESTPVGAHETPPVEIPSEYTLQQQRKFNEGANIDENIEIMKSSSRDSRCRFGFAIDAAGFKWDEEEYGYDEYGYDEYPAFYDDETYDFEMLSDAAAEEAKRRAEAAAAVMALAGQPSRDARTPVEDGNELGAQNGSQTLGLTVGKSAALELKASKKNHSAEKDDRTPVMKMPAGKQS